MEGISFNHLTLNTGHSLWQKEFKPLNETVHKVLSGVPGTMRLSGPFENYVVEAHRVDGMCRFQLMLMPQGATRPISVLGGFGCWEAKRDDAAWNMAITSYRELVRHGAVRPQTSVVVKPQLPWLGIMLLDAHRELFESGVDLGWMGDFERCLFWKLWRS